MNIKKIVSSILAAALAFGSVNIGMGMFGTVKGAGTAFAADVIQDGNLQYTELSDGTLEVTCQDDYKSTITSAVIPSTVNGKKVTSIGDYAFSNCTNLVSVTIPSGVTNIGDYAFRFCGNLSSAAMPNSVKSIGAQAFANCYSLNSITIPSSVTSIGDYAFFQCDEVTSLTIPAAVTSLGDDIVQECRKLANIYVDPANTAFTSVGGILFNKDKTKLIRCPEANTVGSYTIPGTVTSIGNEAFYCTGLTSVTIPSSVKTIGDSAFYGTDITSVTIPSSITSIGESVFAFCPNLTSVSIPNTVTSIGNAAFECSGLTSVKIPGSVKSIGVVAFEDCTSLSAVTLSSGLTSIGDYAFSGCSGLKSITIPSSVKSVGDDAFGKCSELTSVSIQNGLTSIGKMAFEDCTSLTAVTIPSSVTSIGMCAFEDCTSLASVTIPGSVKTIEYRLFGNCTGLTAVTISNGVTSIEGSVFSGCTKLSSITIPNSVSSIGVNAFENTPWDENQPNGLVYAGKVAYKYKGDMPTNTSITLKSDTSGIANSAFINCWGLTSIAIPSSVTNIGGSAFSNCTRLSSVTIPGGVTNIEGSSFSNCTALTSVTIPSSVTYIGVYAFDNCESLKDVYYTGSKEQWDSIFIWVGNDDLSNATIHYNYNPVGAMSNLKITPGKSTAKLSWDKNTSAAYYRVYAVKNGTFTQLTQTANNSVLSYTVTGLAPSATYTYRVIAFNSSNKSIASSDISAKTLSNIGSLTVSPGKTTAKLTWAKNPNAANYKLSILKNGTYTTLKTTTGSTLTATELVPSANYTLRVSALDAAGKMIGYSDITTKTLSNIGNLTVSPGKTTVKLTWSKNPNAKTYNLSILKNGAYTTLKTTTGSTLTATELVPSANYTLRISAFDAAGKMIGYSDITTKTLSNIGNLTVSPGKTTAKLTWAKNPNAANYKLSILKNGTYTTLKTTTGSTLTATELVPSANYTLRVSALDTTGKMIGYSDITTKTLSNIGNLTVSPGKTTAKLTWAKNPNAANYKLSILKNGAYTTLKTTTGSTLTATGLVPSANYTLRISAFDASGKMIGYSDITTKTLSNIGNLTVTPYKNSATLRWSKNPNAASYSVLIQKNGSYTTYAKTTGGVYTVAGLNANISYNLRVSAYDASGKMIGYSDISAKTAVN